MTDFDLFRSRPRRGLVSFSFLLLESFSFLDVDSFSFLGDKDSFSFLGELDSFSFLGESFCDAETSFSFLGDPSLSPCLLFSPLSMVFSSKSKMAP